jgi:hypothetical protein
VHLLVIAQHHATHKKAPHKRGFSQMMLMRLHRAAASIGKDEADGADTADGPNHDDRGRPYHDDGGRALDDDNAAAIGLASAIGAAMPAGAASARGIRGAEACERPGDQNCSCEKVLHVLSHLGPQRGVFGRKAAWPEPRFRTMNGT